MMWQHIWGDLKQACRLLRKSPVVTAIACGSLAVAFAATTVGFAVFDAVLFRPLPVADPSKFVWVYVSDDARHAVRFGRSSYDDFRHIRGSRILADVAAEYSERLIVETPDGSGARRDFIGFVSPNYFSAIGATLRVGRSFSPGHGAEIVLSYSAWRRYVGNDSNRIGQTVTINGAAFVVIGVAPPAFNGITDRNVFGWITDEHRQTVGYVTQATRQYSIAGRLAHSQSQASATQRLNTLARSLAELYPAEWRKSDGAARVITVLTDPEKRAYNGQPHARVLIAGFAGVAFIILALACTNVAGVMYARHLARRHEIAVRMAVGATRLQIASGLAAESAVLAIAAAALGWLVTWWALWWSQARSALALSLEWPIIAIAVLTPGVCVMLFGFFPLLHALKADARAVLHGAYALPDATAARGRVIALEVALSFTLLVGGLTVFRSVQRQLSSIDGYDGESILLAFGESHTPEQRPEDVLALERGKDAVLAIPGVRDAAIVKFPPLSNSMSTMPLKMEDGSTRWVEVNYVDDNYFALVDLRPLTGRLFDSQDRTGSAVVGVVNETLARSIGKDVLGATLNADLREPIRVIGVVPDARYHARTDVPKPYVYLVREQHPPQRSRAETLIIRVSHGSADHVASAVSGALTAEVGGRVPPKVLTLKSYVLADARSQRQAALVVLILGSIEMCLAMLGWYGLIVVTILARTRDIGIRRALGAAGSRAVLGALAEVAKYAAVGIALGVVASVPVLMVCERFQIGTGATDAVPLGVSVVAVVMSLGAAAFGPVWRGARQEPVVALRYPG